MNFCLVAVKVVVVQIVVAAGLHDVVGVHDLLCQLIRDGRAELVVDKQELIMRSCQDLLGNSRENGKRGGAAFVVFSHTAHDAATALTFNSTTALFTDHEKLGIGGRVLTKVRLAKLQ